MCACINAMILKDNIKKKVITATDVNIFIENQQTTSKLHCKYFKEFYVYPCER